jgi:O-antigen/teichoic acid export membrane protein
MRRFFVKNLAFVVAINLLIRPVYVLLIDRVVQNKVGAASFGSYAALFNLALVFSIILDFGITNYNSRTVSQNPDKLQELFPTMLSARLILILVYIAIVGITGLIVGYSSYQMLLLGGILVFQSLNYMLQFLRSNVAALHKFKIDGVLSITDRLLMIVVCGALLLYPVTAQHFKIEWYILAQAGSYSVGCIIAFFVLRWLHPIRFRFSFHGQTILRIIKDTIPYATLIFLMSIYTRLDLSMIERLGGADGKVQAGIFTAAYRYLDMSNMFALMFASILLPLFGRMLKENQAVNQIIHVCVNTLLPVSFIVAVAAVFFGTPIMQLLYHAAKDYPDPDYYGHVFRWIMAEFPAFCIMYIYSTLLTANGSLKTLNKLALAGVIFNLGLNLYVIPRYKAEGATIVSFLTQWLMAAGFIFYCIKEIKLKVEVKMVTSLISYLILLIILGVGATHIPASWWVQIVVFGGVGAGLMFAFRFISVDNVKQLMSKKGTGRIIEDRN